MGEKQRQRSIWLTEPSQDPDYADSAADLLRNARGVIHVEVARSDHLLVSYNVREITLQILEALLTEFGYKLRTSLFCRTMRALCYYIEDIECTSCKHNQADCTRDAFITRYLRRPHGCRDHRPEYLRRYL
ncbi:MAG TPA: hypothetical protein ENG26_00830 [Gammaproteobacteria bacterium]|nr:hypothetical protein [Gammaproteobacteria bacterium]